MAIHEYVTAGDFPAEDDGRYPWGRSSQFGSLNHGAAADLNTILAANRTSAFRSLMGGKRKTYARSEVYRFW